jgi:hypothetical protein
LFSIISKIYLVVGLLFLVVVARLMGISWRVVTPANLADFFNARLACSKCFQKDFTAQSSSKYQSPRYEVVSLDPYSQVALVTITATTGDRDFYAVTKKWGQLQVIYQRMGAGFSPDPTTWHDAKGAFLLHSAFANSYHHPFFTVILSWNPQAKLFEERVEENHET